MTVVEIAVDLIRERDQLRKRIRELEAHIKELEEQVWGMNGLEQDVNDFRGRITKAREILTEEALQWMCIEPEVEKDIQRALEALEGK